MVGAWRFSIPWWFGGASDDRNVGTGRPRAHARARDLIAAARAPLRAIGGIEAAELVARLRGGDRVAFDVLYTELFDTLTRLAVVRARSLAVAQEAVHDVFLALWLRRETLDPNTDLRVYLAASIRNRTRNLRDHDAIVMSTESAVRHDAVPPAMARPGALPDAAAEAGEFHAAYRAALTLLSERERAAALLRWESGFTFEQIGQVLGISTVGARAVILRAQLKVRAGLDKYRG